MNKKGFQYLNYIFAFAMIAIGFAAISIGFQIIESYYQHKFIDNNIEVGRIHIIDSNYPVVGKLINNENCGATFRTYDDKIIHCVTNYEMIK
jgi:hypothetical protein